MCLVNYPIATAGSLLLVKACIDANQVELVDALFGWTASLLLASALWFTLEPAVQRLWGARRPTEREQLRLESALGGVPLGVNVPASELLIEDTARIGVRVGVRTMVLTHGALQSLSDPELASLLSHGLGHLGGRMANPFLRCKKSCVPL